MPRERMASVVPGARLVVQLRNPVDRAYSHYCFARTWGVEHRSFERAVAEELDGEINVPGGEYLGRGRYLASLEKVCERYSRDAMLVVLFDDITAHPSATYHEVCRFIGVDDTFVPEVMGRPSNPSRVVRSSWLWRRTRRYRMPLRAPGTHSARLDDLNSRPYVPLDQSMRRKLVAHFSSDNAALGEWLGRDLGGWSS